MEPRESAAFPSTHLSLVQLAATPDAPGWQEAWERFFRAYWRPLHGYLRRTGSSHADALDLLQEFFLAGARGDLLARYEPGRGRLRSYLLACLGNLRRKDWRRQRARPAAVSWLELEPAEELAAGDPAARFEDEWNRCVQERAIAGLKERLAAEGDALSQAVLREWVLSPTRGAASAVAARLGLSPNALYTRATRLRRDLVAEVERCLRDLEAAPAELASERDAILRLLRGETA